MAHRLFPPEGRDYLTTPQVLQRLRAEFGLVDVDREAGADHVGGMIEQFLRMNLPHMRAQVSSLQAVQSEAVQVTLAAQAESEGLAFVVIPGEPLFVGYSSAEHEAASQALLERCATALGYEVELT